MTGKPSIDMLYHKNYPKCAAGTKLPEMKLDEYFLEINGKDLDRAGLIFAPTGQEISIGTMIEEYNNVAKSLTSMGLKPGDNVAVCLLNSPEIVYVLFACSKIGLTVNMINPKAPPMSVIKRVKSLHPKVLIAHDKTAPLFNIVKHFIKLPYIVTTPIVKGETDIGVKPMDKNVGWWEDFINIGKHETRIVTVPYDKEQTLVHTHSSGSTGPTKPIMLGHDTFTHTAHMHLIAGLDYKAGDKWLAAIPALFSTGVNSSVMLPILIKLTTILEPNYDLDVFLKNILRFMPHGALATKYFWKKMLEHPDYKNVDLSFLRYGVIAGEKIKQHETRRFDNFLEEHNNTYGIKNGYGQCELGGGIGNSCLNEKTKGNNTIGFPYTHNVIVIKDLETGEEKGYNERGEVTAKTTTAMLGYHDMPYETAQYFRNGVANLGDIGYVNEKGEYYVDCRISDKIAVDANIYIFPYEIEDIIERLMESDPVFDKAIIDYAVYGYSIGKYEVPTLQIYLADEYIKEQDALLIEINSIICKNIGFKNRKIAYKVRTEPLPASVAGKTDIKPLKREKKGFFKVGANQIKPFRL